MSRTKSLLRNAQRIGNCHTPDLSQEPSQDLLKKLKEYRANSITKYSSPQKPSGSKAMIISPSPSKNSSSYQIMSSRTSRPCTSPYPDTLLRVSNKIAEKPSHQPNKHSHDSSYQERSNDRLYRGARVVIGRPNPEGLLEKSERKEVSRHFDREEEMEFADFLDSIRFLYPLRFDLELNFEVIRGEMQVHQNNMLGDYYSLRERIEGLLKSESENMKDITSGEIVKVLQEYNRIVRHILLGLKLKEQDNEAAIVEMLWRVIVKLFDNALILHERNSNDLIDMSKTKAKNLIKDFKEKLTFSEERYVTARDDYEKRIEKYQEQVKSLQSALSIKEKALAERDERMADLLEVGSRDKSCLEMSRVLKKLNVYISETEDQQYKQVAALSGIEHVMKLAQTFDDKEESTVTETQTEWSLPNNSFPEYAEPKISFNYFHALFRPCPDIEKNLIIRNCCQALDESDGEQQFYKQYGEHLIKNYSKTDIENMLVATAWCVLKPDCVKTSLFAALLRFQDSVSVEFELALLKINQVLLGIENKHTDGMLPLNKVIEMLQLLMPSNKEQVETLLSAITCHTYFPIEIKRNIWIGLARLYFALEKTKKPMKFHIDSLDTKKEGISNRYTVQGFVMIEWMKNKLGLWMKDSEIMSIIEYFGGDIMRSQSVLERFSAAKLEKCKEIYVCKEEVLLILIGEWKKYQANQMKACKNLPRLESYQE